jgi:pseudouridine synthase
LERLQKTIAAAGLASRREAERLILAGRVQVNGRVVTLLGTRVDPHEDVILVDGKALGRKTAQLYLMLHKPRGVLTASSDPEGRRTVIDLLEGWAAARGPRRVFHVGRLDYNSEGLVLLTNDGALASRLSHPSNGVPRTYQARVQGEPGDEDLKRLLRGVPLEDGPAAALDVQVLKRNPRSTWLELVVAEGRNRLVRRMCEHLGHPVLRLVRVAYGGLELGRLPAGKFRELLPDEVDLLRRWGQEPAAD